MTRKQIVLLTHPYTDLTRISTTVNPYSMIENLSKGAGARLEITYISPLLFNYHVIEQKVLKHFKDKVKLSKWINRSPEEIKNYIKSLEDIFNEAEFNLNTKPKQIDSYIVYEGLTEQAKEKTEEKYIYYNNTNTKYYLIVKIWGVIKTVECINLDTARKLKKEFGGYLI